MVIRFPPDVEVPVGQFYDWEGENLPAFFHLDHQPDFVGSACPIFKIDTGSGEQAGIQDVEFILLKAESEVRQGNRIANLKIQFPQDDVGFGALVPGDINVPDGDVVQVLPAGCLKRGAISREAMPCIPALGGK